MFRRPSNKRILSSLGAAFVFATLLSSTYLSSQSTAHPSSTKSEMAITIRGHALAEIELLGHGAGVGPHWTKFIFAWEASDSHMRPVEIAYAYFGRTGLPDSFFDYSKAYELKASREASCDETVSSLSLIKAVDESGRELPPTNALYLLDGAPKNVLKPDMVLPCYIVYEGGIRELSTAK